MKIFSFLSRTRQTFMTDSLFRNATLLMASTAIMSVLGFGFWIFVAHLYTPSQIGVASALISITTLLSNLSLLGLNAGLIRFLPGSKNQSRDINAALLMVAAVTIVAATGYVLIAGSLGADLSILATSWHKIGFILLMTTVSLNSLTDAIFIANRRAEYHTAAYGVLGIVKLILPLFLIPLGSLGIFSAYIIAMIASLVFSLFLMKRSCGYHFRARPNWVLLKKMRKYTTHNYVGVVLGGLASQILPIQIVHRLGSAQAAYFSMAWMMANLLYVVPSAATQSLLAESSFNPADKTRHVKHTTKILAAILIPAVILSIVIAPYLLSVFGANYSMGSTRLFQILALSTFFVAACNIGGTLMNIEQRTNGIMIMQFATAATAIGMAQFTIRYGLTGIGIALLGGNIAGTISVVVLQFMNKNHRPVNEGVSPMIIEQTLPSFLREYGLDQADVGVDIGGGDRSYTVIVSHGTEKYVLKASSAKKRSRADIEEEIRFTDFLRDKGVPVPHLVSNMHSDMITIVDTQNEEWYGTLMKFEKGYHPDTYPPLLLRSMAKMQALIHSAGIEYAEQANVYGYRSRRNIKSALLLMVPKGMSHFDFDAGNILTDGNDIICVLDFEGMRFDPVVICTYFTLGRIYAARNKVADIRSYLDAYEEVRPMHWIEKQLIRLLIVGRFYRIRLPGKV
jgi:O-antigen/teichoic acid export membrane protein/Ser/Thr protein kinase RdoA (MazF antagonist)